MARGKILGFSSSTLIVALLIVGYLFVPTVNTAINDLWSSIAGSIGLSGVTTTGNYVGNVNYVITIQDLLTGATAAPTGDAYYWYSEQPSSSTGGVALTTTGHVMQAQPSGYAWLVFDGASDFLFCGDYFSSMNSAYVVPGSGFWADLNDDNDVDYCVKIDTSKIGVTGQAQTPTMNLVAPWLEEDATLTLSSPADADGTGAAETVVTITWEVTTCAADDGFAITRLYFTDNNTIASGICHPEQVYISNGLGGGGQAMWSAPVKQVEGATAYYYYITGDPDYRHFFNGERYWVETGEPATIYVTAKVRVDLVAGANLTIYIDQCDSAGTITTDSDAVAINIES